MVDTNNLLPREKALTYGIDKLLDYELLALILRTGTKDLNVIDLAQKIISDIKTLDQLILINDDYLKSFKGIGTIKALEFLAYIELIKRINQGYKQDFHYANNPEMIFKLYQLEFRFQKQEHFKVLCLNSKNAIIADSSIFIGTLSYSLIHPREVFKEIIMNSLASFICLHNHPSGDSTPSKDDIDVTKQLKEVSHILAIPFLDHIIIGKDSYFSFKENNLL